MLSSALDYERRCFSVLVVGADKRPIGSWKIRQQERAGPDLIREWFYDRPNANIGIVTGRISGLVVVDTDSNTAETYAAGRGMPSTPTVKTKKGKHRYYRYPDDRTIKNKQALHGVAGLDIRGEGGYVVAPPSLHPEGVRYEWETPLSTPLAPLPAWVWEPPPPPSSNGNREHAYLEAAIRGKLADACARVRAAQDGTKHETLRDNSIIIGGYLHYGVVTHGEAEAALFDALPPTVESRQQALRTIRDGLEHGVARPLTVDAPQPAPQRERPAPQRSPQEGEEPAENTITVDGRCYRLPPGCTYSRGTIWRGERLLYLGKILVRETGNNIHTGEQTAQVSWNGTAHGQTVALLSDLASQSGTTRNLGGAGAAVHAHNSKDLSRYLIEFIAVNRDILPQVQHSEYYGWAGDGLMLPSGNINTKATYIGKPIWVGENPHAYRETLQAIAPWATPTLLAVLAFCLSSPLYARIKPDRNPVIHLGGPSGSGKTTIAHFGTGCYGDPRVVPLQVQGGSGTTTPKGLATALVQANGLPLFLDDVHKMLEKKRAETEGIIYDYANAQARTWGTMGNRHTAGGQELRGLLITAGETSLNFLNAGSHNRVFSFDCGSSNQSPLGCAARSAEGTRRARQIQAAWQGGAGLFGGEVMRRVLGDWRAFGQDVRAFEQSRHLGDLQAWRRLLAVAAATLQVAAIVADLELEMDALLRDWSAILQDNNQSHDPAAEAFDRLRTLMIQCEHVRDHAHVPKWHSLLYDRKLVAVRREEQDYWRVLHTTSEYLTMVGGNSVEMFGATWIERGWVVPHKSGRISDTSWIGRGSPRCILVVDFLGKKGTEEAEGEL